MRPYESSRRWLRRLGAAVAVSAVAMVTPVVTAAPAGAVSQTAIHPEWVDGCEGCPGPLHYVQVVLDRRVKAIVTKSVADGLSGMIAASQTQDPVAAKRLRDVAIRTLAGGAAQAGNAAWVPGEWDGDICPRRPWPYPGPWPLWNDTQRTLGDGLTLLGQYNRTGDAGLLTAATGKLDAGAVALLNFRGCV